MDDSKLKIEMNQYYEQLSEFEKKAYDIAKDHLGTTFDIKRSNGFLRWKSKK